MQSLNMGNRGNDGAKVGTIRVQDLINDLKGGIPQLLMLLSEKERTVIEKRFSLSNNKKYTLEEIGQDFSVTRERIRQIEKNALRKLKRNIGNFDAYGLNNIAHGVLLEHGGILREDVMISKLISEKAANEAFLILLLLSLDNRFERVANTILFSPYFKLIEISTEVIDSICRLSESILAEHGELMNVGDIRRALKENGVELFNLTDESLLSIFDVYKKTKKVDNQVGLMKWRHINPRTLRDKIFYVLRHRKKPTHFVEISNLIVNHEFDKKNVNLQAIHNELIRHPDFILIGRGIYALSEWGYEAGTVAEVIEDILKNVDSMDEEKIVEAVMERRKVKRITIILNLKNKPKFTRIGRKQYKLKK